uniref:DUF4198 domain-containing protein n=1 Tax=Haemonchus contortus TaxID=6289 RepID=A0A7I4YMC2_HAECO
MPWLRPRNRRSRPDTLCDVVMTVLPVQLLTGSEQQDGVSAMIRLSGFFMEAVDEKNALPHVLRASTVHWSTVTLDRDEWRRFWRPLEKIDDQRDDR